MQSGTSEVLYIDYGNSELLPSSELRVLPSKFGALSAQAIHCSLSRVFDKPGAGNTWTDEDIKAFTAMTDLDGGFLEIEVELYNREQLKHFVELKTGKV